MKKDEIKLNIENGILTISGEKKTEREKKEKGKYFHFERTYGSFTRSFRLPETVKTDSVKAEYKDGVLHIELQKGEEAKHKLIEIK